MEPLTEQERKFVALAIQGLALRSGPPLFTLAEESAKKLGLSDLLVHYLRDWIGYKEQQDKSPAPPPAQPDGMVRLADVLALIERMVAQYPEDVFPPQGQRPDDYGARGARWMAGLIATNLKGLVLPQALGNTEEED